MKKLQKVFGLVFILGVCVFMPQLATAAALTPDTNWYSEGASSFTISTAAQFAGLAELVNEGDSNGKKISFDGKTINLANDINLGGELNCPPVGRSGYAADFGSYFSGTFNGNGHSITGVNIALDFKDSYVGLFGHVIGGTITNLKVGGTIRAGEGGNSNIGGVVGYNDGGTVENCTNMVNVDGSSTGVGDAVGGVVGINTGPTHSGDPVVKDLGIVKNCTNEGTVRDGGMKTGGVVGWNGQGTVENCTNKGTVTSAKGSIGGVVGFNNAGNIVRGSTNSGAVSMTGSYDDGSVVVGGIVGANEDDNETSSTVENCTNTGAVTVAGTITWAQGSASVGGVIGLNAGSLVKGSTNNGGIVSVTGTVTSNKKYIGGIVGHNSNSANNSGKVETCTWVRGSGGGATWGIGEPASNNGVTIVGSAIPVTGVTLSHSSVKLTAGQELDLTATVAPATATNKNVTWESDAPTVVQIAGTGPTVVLKALSAGDATITVTTADGGKKATCDVTVKAQSIKPTEPDLPEGTNPEVKPAQPKIIELVEEAAGLMPNMKPTDLEVIGNAVRLKGDITMALAKKALQTDDDLETLPLPVFSADVPYQKIAAIGFELTGDELFAKEPSEVLLMKVVSSDHGELFSYESTPSKFDDGKFTLMNGGNVHTGTIVADAKYQLVLFIKDGGKYDLDLTPNSKVVDPLALVSSAENAEEDPKRPGVGCSAGYATFALLFTVPLVLLRKRK